MSEQAEVYEYETCISTGPQYLNPDGGPETLTSTKRLLNAALDTWLAKQKLVNLKQQQQQKDNHEKE